MNQASESTDVVVLVAPSRGRVCNRFLRAIAEIKATSRAAVLVVFARVVDDATMQRFATAGADLCVVAPTGHELFGHIQRTRALFRAREPSALRSDDELLDALWSRRSPRE